MNSNNSFQIIKLFHNSLTLPRAFSLTRFAPNQYIQFMVGMVIYAVLGLMVTIRGTVASDTYVYDPDTNNRIIFAILCLSFIYGCVILWRLIVGVKKRRNDMHEGITEGSKIYQKVKRSFNRKKILNEQEYAIALRFYKRYILSLICGGIVGGPSLFFPSDPSSNKYGPYPSNHPSFVNIPRRQMVVWVLLSSTAMIALIYIGGTILP